MLLSPAEPSEPQFHFDNDDAHTLIIPVVPLEDDDSPDPDDVPTTSGSAYDILEEYSFPSKSCLCNTCNIRNEVPDRGFVSFCITVSNEIYKYINCFGCMFWVLKMCLPCSRYSLSEGRIFSFQGCDVYVT